MPGKESPWLSGFGVSYYTSPHAWGAIIHQPTNCEGLWVWPTISLNLLIGDIVTVDGGTLGAVKKMRHRWYRWMYVRDVGVMLYSSPFAPMFHSEIQWWKQFGSEGNSDENNLALSLIPALASPVQCSGWTHGSYHQIHVQKSFIRLFIDMLLEEPACFRSRVCLCTLP